MGLRELDAAGEEGGSDQDDRITTDQRQARVVVQIDEQGMSQDLPLSEDAGPCLAIRLQPMPGDLCRFSYTSLAEDQDARLLLPTSEVVDKIATTSEWLWSASR